MNPRTLRMIQLGVLVGMLAYRLYRERQRSRPRWIHRTR